MIIKVSNKILKQPIELFIEDTLWHQLNAIADKSEFNRRILDIALKHIGTNGYNIGYCNERNREVTLSDCMKCGVSKGWGSGKENYTRWEECKIDHINYKASPARVLTNKIKDKKIKSKMMPSSKAETIADRQTISEVQRTNDNFDKQSEQFMKEIKKRENQ